MDYPRLVLKSGRDRSILNFHPWVYSGAVKSRPPKAGDGEIVAVYSSQDELLGLGHYAPQATLICRIFHFGNEAPETGEAYWMNKLKKAQEYRRQLPGMDTTSGYRLVHAEGDGMPGVVIDIYGDAAAVQLRSSGTPALMPVIRAFLEANLGIQSIFMRTDRKEEAEGVWVTGSNEERKFTENGLSFYVDIESGQKTGFFLDQRANRDFVRAHAKDRKVLNAFAYSGAFSVFALAGGAASVESVDISGSAVELAERNVALNFGGERQHTAIKTDAFEYLRSMEAGKFDLIVLDPPAFTKHISTVQKAARGYKDINLKAIKKIAPGGLLFTFSCSQHVSTDLFRKIVFGAAADAGRSVRIVHQLSQAPDHPVSIYHPEGEYLKGLCLYVE